MTRISIFSTILFLIPYLCRCNNIRETRSGILTDTGYHSLRHGTVLEEEPRARGQCGIRRSTVPDAVIKIVGGSTAEKHEFPWQVSLQWRFNQYTYHVCGASLLSDRWIVTAAHCTHQFKATDLVVVAGEHHLKQQEGTEQTREISQLIEHEKYDVSTQANDIVLIKVSRPFHLDGLHTNPICLPPANYKFSGFGIVTGWGKLAESGESAEILQKVFVPIISDSKCAREYQAIGYAGPIVNSMICAGYPNGAHDACQGDSGGPYVARGPDKRYYLTGIVSWGIGCARPNVPGVYTEVSHYVQWMHNVVNSHGGRSDISDGESPDESSTPPQ